MKNSKGKYQNTTGISFLLVLGSWGGFHYTQESSAVHLCLGFVAVTVFFYDVENTLYNILNKKQ